MAIPLPQRDAIEELLDKRPSYLRRRGLPLPREFKTNGRSLALLGISKPRNRSGHRELVAVFGYKDDFPQSRPSLDPGQLKKCDAWVLARRTNEQEQAQTGNQEAVELLEPWTENFLQCVGQPAYYSPV